MCKAVAKMQCAGNLPWAPPVPARAAGISGDLERFAAASVVLIIAPVIQNYECSRCSRVCLAALPPPPTAPFAACKRGTNLLTAERLRRWRDGSEQRSSLRP